jgi:nucleoside-diphosphate-sugar epimerase
MPWYGAAGFVRSHLTKRLRYEGYEVLGVDSFTDYYDIAQAGQPRSCDSRRGKVH